MSMIERAKAKQVIAEIIRRAGGKFTGIYLQTRTLPLLD
jgi:hypothetical protein